ncbi:MAG: flagellar hook-basal body complex protein FliE [Actinobacteria bacterium]|nr:flagellar hook-basal body complex protein FliE [Actinomycetota bacterium]
MAIEPIGPIQPELRALRPSAASPGIGVNVPRSPGSDGPESGPSFTETLKQALGEVNRLQVEADQASMALVTGQTKDLHQVVIATEKASLALQLTLQIRNKVLEAYQEIMRMQV